MRAHGELEGVLAQAMRKEPDQRRGVEREASLLLLFQEPRQLRLLVGLGERAPVEVPDGHSRIRAHALQRFIESAQVKRRPQDIVTAHQATDRRLEPARVEPEPEAVTGHCVICLCALLPLTVE